MTKLPEVISTVRRRRAWSVEEKVAILDAAFRKGGSVAATSEQFGMSRALIYIWRTQVQNGLLLGVTMMEAASTPSRPSRFCHRKPRRQFSRSQINPAEAGFALNAGAKA